MKESESYDLLNSLRAGPVGVSSPDELAKARERIVPWLEHQVTSLPQRRAMHRTREQRTKVLWGGSALIAAAAGVLMMVTIAGQSDNAQAELPEPTTLTAPGYATLVSGKVMSGSVDVLVGSRLGLSSRVETNEAEAATLRTSDGYEVSLSPRSAMAFLPGHGNAAAKQRELRLYHGVVTLAVAPLPPGSSLSVLTDDAKVTVVGTQFSVESKPGDSTCVRVKSGKVKVESASSRRLLGAGETWGCQPLEALPPKPAKSSSTAPPKRARSSPPVTTTLKQESALLSAGISSERQGRSSAARRSYEALLRKYPRSSFAQDARAGLLRLKATPKEK